MCGIFGFNRNNANLRKTFFSDLKHRGPDAQDAAFVSPWTLGHLRLSIIDESPGANQPFEKGGNYMIFNGEIYNYLELQKEYLPDVLLDTNSDTEVLLELLNCFGTDILHKLNGMFAFAWYHHESQNLYLCRDRFGVKPLYYTNQADTFFFSSEIRPLTKRMDRVELDPAIVRSFFTDTATDFDERSGLVDIHQVGAGCFLEVDTSGATRNTKWYQQNDYEFDTSIFSDKTATLLAFEDLLTDAIAIRHRSDVPVCITLSGGLDSTTLYVLAKERLQSKIKPFVFSHQGAQTDESDRAIQLAQKYNDEPIVVSSRPEQSVHSLTTALRHLEFPIWNPSAIAYLDMYESIQEHGYKVVIEGHGSDEQLGGYPYMIEAAWKQALLQGKWTFAKTIFRVWRQTNNPALDQPDSQTTTTRKEAWLMGKGLFRGFVKALIWPHKRKYLDFDRLVRESFDYKILPIVLRAFDRLSMAKSLESRCPFMDYRVVEFLRRMPLEYKVSELGSKAILREILKKYGHPEIYQNKSKMGFASDLPALFKSQSVRSVFTEAIDDFSIAGYEQQKAQAESTMQKPELGWADIDKIWKVAALSLTIKQYENQ